MATCPGNPDGPICDVYQDVARCPAGARRTVIGCRPLCQDITTCAEVAPLPPKTCSGNLECAPTELCVLDGQCVVSGAKAGTCQPRPSTCPDNDSCPSVCGCDGKTHCSACEAHEAGVSVATTGACLAPTCAALESEYAKEIEKAKQCCPMCAALQCATVAAPLGCGCQTTVNALTPRMTTLRQQWMALGCRLTQPPCGIRCASPKPAACLPTSAPPGPGSGLCSE